MADPFSFENSVKVQSKALSDFISASAKGLTYYVCKPGYIAIVSCVDRAYCERIARHHTGYIVLIKADYEAALAANGVKV